MAPMDTQQKRNLYLNTAVFCLIAGTVSVVLLLMLVYGGDLGARAAPFIVTTEVGIIGVVVWALAVVVDNERRAARMAQNKLSNLVAVQTCPDYWTEDTNGTCRNSYTAPSRMDGDDGTSTVYTLPGASASLNLSDFDKQPMGSLCAKVRQQGSAWTDLQTACSANQV